MKAIKDFFEFIKLLLWDLFDDYDDQTIWIDEADHIPEEVINTILEEKRPDPLNVPGLDAGIPSSGQ